MITKIDMDNGNFPLAKDALRVLVKTKLTGSHRALIDVIWLNTYGWHDPESTHEQKIKQRKTEARISQKTFMEETWMEKAFVTKRLNELVDWKIILRDRNTKPATYSFNVNVDQWVPDIFRSIPGVNPDTCCMDELQVSNLTTIVNPDPLRCQSSHLLGVNPDNCCQPQTPNIPSIEDPLNNILNNTLNNIYIVVFEHWNKQQITAHKELNADTKKLIDTAIKKYGLDAVKQGIERYSMLYHDPEYYFGYKWSLMNFLKRKNGLPDFLDGGEKWLNYQGKKDNSKKARAPDKRPNIRLPGEDDEIL